MTRAMFRIRTLKWLWNWFQMNGEWQFWERRDGRVVFVAGKWCDSTYAEGPQLALTVMGLRTIQAVCVCFVRPMLRQFFTWIFTVEYDRLYTMWTRVATEHTWLALTHFPIFLGLPLNVTISEEIQSIFRYQQACSVWRHSIQRNVYLIC